MRRVLVYKADQERGREWREILARDAPDIEFRMWPDTGPADEVNYLVVWQPPSDLHAHLPKLKVVFSVAAGVTTWTSRPSPRGCRSSVWWSRASRAP